MPNKTLGRVMWRAGEDADFLRRLQNDFGMALAEEGYTLDDDEMHTLRTYNEEFRELPLRAARERALAIARSQFRRS